MGRRFAAHAGAAVFLCTAARNVIAG